MPETTTKTALTAEELQLVTNIQEFCGEAHARLRSEHGDLTLRDVADGCGTMAKELRQVPAVATILGGSKASTRPLTHSNVVGLLADAKGTASADTYPKGVGEVVLMLEQIAAQHGTKGPD